MAAPGTEDLRLPLRNLGHSLRPVAAQLREGESFWNSEDFDLQFFWNTLDECFKAISQEATKLSLLFSKPPLPSVNDCQKLADDIQKSVLNLSTVYYWLPKSQGVTLRRLVRDAAVEIVEGVIQLVDVIVNTPLQRCQLQSNRFLGDLVKCETQLISHLYLRPTDNKAAVLSVMSSYASIVKDALEEMEQAQHEDNPDPFSDILDDGDLDARGNQDTYWSEADRQIMAPSLGLMKASKACLKKVSGAVKAHGKTDNLQHIAQLDDLGDVTNEISPSIDDLALSLYPPMSHTAVRFNAAKLASILKKVLEITKFSHVCPESESSWVEFLNAAIDHNIGKVKNLTQGSII